MIRTLKILVEKMKNFLFIILHKLISKIISSLIAFFFLNHLPILTLNGALKENLCHKTACILRNIEFFCLCNQDHLSHVDRRGCIEQVISKIVLYVDAISDVRSYTLIVRTFTKSKKVILVRT
jgi:hypothetical protein